MHRQHQRVLRRGHADHESAQQQIAREIKRAAGFLLQPAMQFLFGRAVAPGTQIHHRHPDGAARRDDLDGAPFRRGEVRPENLVAANNLVQRLLERGKIERALHPYGLTYVVYGTAWLELVEEPEAL